MTKEKYLEMRNELYAQAQEALKNSELELAKSKRAEIESLDQCFEEEAREMANLAALEDKAVQFEPQNQTVKAEGMTHIGATNVEEDLASYEDVFAKFALGNRLNEAEAALFNHYNPQNAYTHDTTNTEVVIPTSVVLGIMKMAEDAHPFFSATRKYNIKGYVKFAKHVAIKAGDAKHYNEATVTEDEQNEFGELELKGFEIAKAVTVSWKLQAMAVSDFIPFLQAELGERIGAVMGQAVINGDGTNAPKGVLKFIEVYNSKSQIVDYKKPLDYAAITTGISKLSSKYVNNAKIYANNATIWNVLANIMDGNGRPLFISDPTSGGVGRILGLIVESEDGLSDNELLIGDARQYVVNFNEPLKLVTEQQAKARKTDFVGYGVYDGGCLDERAFAHVKGAVKSV